MLVRHHFFRPTCHCVKPNPIALLWRTLGNNLKTRSPKRTRNVSCGNTLALTKSNFSLSYTASNGTPRRTLCMISLSFASSICSCSSIQDIANAFCVRAIVLRWTPCRRESSLADGEPAANAIRTYLSPSALSLACGSANAKQRTHLDGNILTTKICTRNKRATMTWQPAQHITQRRVPLRFVLVIPRVLAMVPT